MTNQITPILTHDTAIATMISKLEANIDALLILNDAISCLSKIACEVTRDQNVDVSQLGCIISLFDDRLRQTTNDMLAQLDAVAPLRLSTI